MTFDQHAQQALDLVSESGPSGRNEEPDLRGNLAILIALLSLAIPLAMIIVVWLS